MPVEAREGFGSAGTRVLGGCEPPEVGAENQVLVCALTVEQTISQSPVTCS